VFDVAGGQGDLVWLLLNADKVNAIVVDPIAPDWSNTVRVVQWLLEHREELVATLAGVESSVADETGPKMNVAGAAGAGSRMGTAATGAETALASPLKPTTPSNDRPRRAKVQPTLAPNHLPIKLNQRLLSKIRDGDGGGASGDAAGHLDVAGAALAAGCTVAGSGAGIGITHSISNCNRTLLQPSITFKSIR
jgi:hypothetical protein